MKANTLKLIVGLITLILISVLMIQLVHAPTFMLPSVYLIGIIITALLVGSLVVAGISKLIFRRVPYFMMLCAIVSITAIAIMLKYYSPTLTIVVPKGYTGKITLVLSNVDKDVLKVDNNGIGYLTKSTYDKTYTKPIVLETSGVNINDQCVGFNPSTFWGKETYSVASTTTKSNANNEDVHSLSFEIVPKDKLGQKQYYSIDLINLVDKTKLYKKE